MTCIPCRPASAEPVPALHHKLFSQEDVSAERLDVSRFLEDLVADLAQAFASEKSLRLLVSSDEGIYLPAERCTTLGLLAVELVLNAIKHAFDDQHTDRTIAVALRRDVDTLVFSVRDNGKDLPDGGLVASRRAWARA
ncbi:hypothetical protein SFA35_11515 [Pseudomonas sp. HR96]|uniref:ATP-binding protein n=1 Tax=Pseudomonas sp. HR96 TaxID=1027966 RepID=UPI002A75411D|nr:ATP-binding protein [Pseudomonas sp. HR96]WPP01932.1 hypothetical protein SFA35_11515 [Pseudomonas sp. HR96]